MKGKMGIRIVLAFAVLALTFSLLSESVMAASGDLVWGINYNPSTGQDAAWGVALDSTGVYVVGSDEIPGVLNGQWRIQKRSKTTGGTIWSQTTNPTSLNDEATSVAVDSTGVYVVGYYNEILLDSGGNTVWRIQKRSPATGALIWSVSTNPSAGLDKPWDVAVDSTGIYVVGFDSSPGNTRWRMEKRSKTTGGLIWSATTNPSAGRDEATSVAVDSTGVYVVGYDTSLGWPNTRWRIQKRSLTTGSLIWSTTRDFSIREDEAMGVAVDATGIYVVGYDTSFGFPNTQWRIEKRSKTTGATIWSKMHNPSVGFDIATGVAVSSTGVYVVGYDYALGGINARWRILKWTLATGALVWSRTSNPSTSADWAEDVAVDSTGVYVAGFAGVNMGWRIEKRQP